MTDLMQSELIKTNHGKHIGLITLNNPKALNAQNLEMVKYTKSTLKAWQNDDSVAMIILRGAGDRALCAGGDIKSLHTGSTTNALDFFENEYGLMHAMHTYPKPILAWGHGIVMGGGLGLLAGSSHKVVTDSTLMAMPEVSIGLFPDAGASYFLNRMMGKIGLFLGLTGARFTGSDALYLGLADMMCHHDDYKPVLARLMATDWADNATNHHILSSILNDFHKPKLVADSQILQNFHTIHELLHQKDLLAVDHALLNYQGNSDYIKSAIELYQQGSAITKALTWHIFHNLRTTNKGFSLQEIFDMETKVAVHCVEHGDFKEGVRALLIDKDKNPKWQFTLSLLTQETIDKYFQ